MKTVITCTIVIPCQLIIEVWFGFMYVHLKSFHTTSQCIEKTSQYHKIYWYKNYMTYSIGCVSKVILVAYSICFFKFCHFKFFWPWSNFLTIVKYFWQLSNCFDHYQIFCQAVQFFLPMQILLKLCKKIWAVQNYLIVVQKFFELADGTGIRNRNFLPIYTNWYRSFLQAN